MSRFQIELTSLLSALIENRLEDMVIPIDLLDTQLIYNHIKYNKLELNKELRRIIISNCFQISLKEDCTVTGITNLVHKIKELLSFKLKSEIQFTFDKDIQKRTQYPPLGCPDIDKMIYQYDIFFHGKIKDIQYLDA